MDEQDPITNALRQKMYFLVLYNLKPIQQGIQGIHAVTKYSNAFRNTDEYRRWATEDDTVVMLDGGGSIKLREHIDYLLNNGLVERMAFFKESDLDNCVTCCCFLADERIWDKKKYPDPVLQSENNPGVIGVTAMHTEFNFDAFIESIGGERNYQLRTYLSKFRSA